MQRQPLRSILYDNGRCGFTSVTTAMLLSEVRYGAT